MIILADMPVWMGEIFWVPPQMKNECRRETESCLGISPLTYDLVPTVSPKTMQANLNRHGGLCLFICMCSHNRQRSRVIWEEL